MKISKNKIYLSLIVLSMVLIFSFVVLKRGNPKIELQELCAETLYIVTSIDDAEGFSDVIVKAKILPDSVNTPHELGVLMGRTFTDIEILDVYSGDLVPGDVIKISEAYYYENDGSQELLIYFNGYLPSKINGEYIFFLGKSSDEELENDYFVIGHAMGRYPCEESFNVTDMDKSIYRISSPLTDTSTYTKVKKDVLEKYN